MKLGLTLALALGAMSPLPSFAHGHGHGYGSSLNLSDFAEYAGTYELVRERRGPCPESMAVGIGGLGKGGSGIGVLSIGAYEFPAINEGWQYYSWGRSNSRVTFNIFSRRPILRNEMYRGARGMDRERREVEVRAKANGIMEVETERKVHQNDEDYETHTKCYYQKSYAEPAPAPIPQEPAPKDQGKQAPPKDQGQGQNGQGQGGQGGQGDLGNGGDQGGQGTHR